MSMKIVAGLGSVDEYISIFGIVKPEQMNFSAGMYHINGQKNMEP